MGIRLEQIFVILGLFVASASCAEDFAPAGFKTGADALTNHIEFPNLGRDGAWLIKCGSWVRTNGRLEGINCLNIGADREAGRELAREIERASRKLTLSPASVDGERKSVYFHFSVGFERHGDKDQIEVFPSHLFDYEKYGPKYTGPQRIHGGVDVNWERCNPLRIWVSADIDQSGNAVDATTGFVEGETRTVTRCERDAEAKIEQASFIPATYNGEYVAAQYEEVFF